MDAEIDYYDKVLGGIAGSLVAGASVGVFTTVPVQFGVGGGAAVSIGIMYHGMFRNGPLG
ncbi:MAG: hypothetical protein ABEJ98_04600 [Candidatus Nanohaloarchaea archaeon]